MSADNWTRCPRCDDRRDKEVAKKLADAKAAYGTVASDEWLQMMNAAQGPQINVDVTTFREDYSIGLHDGVLEISYTGHCKACGLKTEFKADKLIWEQIR